MRQDRTRHDTTWHGMTWRDTARQDMTLPTWHGTTSWLQMATAAPSPTRATHTLPVNPNGCAIPNAHSAISNAHRQYALSAKHSRRAPGSHKANLRAHTLRPATTGTTGATRSASEWEHARECEMWRRRRRRRRMQSENKNPTQRCGE